MNKEFLYVGYYFDVNNRFILKPGTTNDLAHSLRIPKNVKKALDIIFLTQDI